MRSVSSFSFLVSEHTHNIIYIEMSQQMYIYIQIKITTNQPNYNNIREYAPPSIVVFI